MGYKYNLLVGCNDRSDFIRSLKLVSDIILVGFKFFMKLFRLLYLVDKLYLWFMCINL